MQEKAKVKPSKKTIAAHIILFLGNILLFFTFWLLNKYDQIRIDQVIFQLKAPAGGANRTLVGNAFLLIGGGGIGLSLLEIFVYYFTSGKINRFLKYDWYKKYSITRFAGVFAKRILSCALVILLVSVSVFISELKIIPYLGITATESDFIKENYVYPNEQVITFPEKKRNVIQLYLESMENTFTSKSEGGAFESNYIPELTVLANENISFTNTTGMGGAMSFTGTTWTAAALVAQTSGIPVKVPLNAETYGGENAFIPGIVSLGEILEKQGYNQTLLVGSEAAFGGRETYFTEHGNYKIVDIKSLKQEGRLEEDYRVWWGYEDDKLFDYAKEELAKLANGSAPFNFTFLTADTHFPDGYLCEDCETGFDTQYANVLACSSKKVYEFIKWCEQQPFYENTTIIISGDHLTMDPKFMENVDENYTRTVYNCIINSAVNPLKETKRTFGTFDMFPTTLAAMGVRIEGDRLGLGTDLFSATPTLAEKYGYEMLELEISKKSVFYNETFLGMEQISDSSQ